MPRTLIKDIKDNIGKEITIAGWVDTRRDHGKLIFFDVRDRSGVVQVVSNAKNADVHHVVESLGSEWVIELRGFVNERPLKMVNPEQAMGDVEIEVKEVIVLAKAEELPFEKEAELNLDTLLDYRPLTLRRLRERAIFKVQHEIVHAYREALTKEGFVELQAPKIVGGDAEGGAGVFKVEYLNNKDAYLATSPQLYKQIMVPVYERVFAVGDVFRAEKHSTTRHLNEYTSLDAEMGFIKDHTDIMAMLEAVLKYISNHIGEKNKKELELLGAALPEYPEHFPAMKLHEAQAIIKKETGEDCIGEKDLSPEHERWLSEYARKTYNSDFIFITHFPIEKAAFYAYDDPNDKGFTCYFDLLFRGVELASGGQRTHEYEALIKKMRLKNLDPEKFSFYLQAFKYGMPPHGGWGMGLERLTQKFLGLANVKEATLFPRDMNRVDMLLSQ